jgi:hypothetical protein
MLDYSRGSNEKEEQADNARLQRQVMIVMHGVNLQDTAERSDARGPVRGATLGVAGGERLPDDVKDAAHRNIDKRGQRRFSSTR